MSSRNIDIAVQYLLDNENNIENAEKMKETILDVTSYLNDNIDDQIILSSLAKLSDESKILIIQQFFRHIHQGSHQTEFDQDKVSILLANWFDIKIGQDKDKEQGIPRDAQKKLPGRVGCKEIHKVKFGETQVYFFVSEEHYAAARELIHCISKNAVITTDTTSPPCAMTEFVPLWLKDRSRHAQELYIDGTDGYHIADYFSANSTSLREHMGVVIIDSSMELGIIANGDALRFHRDRLVNQYAFLEKTDEPRSAFSVAQSLTLIDWDMQANTMSGTILDHPNGDRYLFSLYPGEIASIFFTEPVKPLGPMMMPYHCALPVIDQSSSQTIGAAKGKRFSTVLRGIVKTENLLTIESNSIKNRVNELINENNDSRRYANGVRIIQQIMPAIQNYRGHIVNDQGEAILILEIPSEENQLFLCTVLGEKPMNARIFRVEKCSTGFSSLERVIPGFSEAERVLIINRSRHCPQETLNYPVAFDFIEHQLPWLQLCPMHVSQAIEIPKSARALTKLSPSDELIHRSALEDSFYQLAIATPRQVIAVDIILA